MVNAGNGCYVSSQEVHLPVGLENNKQNFCARHVGMSTTAFLCTIHPFWHVGLHLISNRMDFGAGGFKDNTEQRASSISVYSYAMHNVQMCTYIYCMGTGTWGQGE